MSVDEQRNLEEESGQLLSADDVQEKEFQVSFRGYNMRQVDEFLDRLTETMRTLQSSPPASEQTGNAAPVSGADDAAVSKFLAQEKSFLESLASLVQDHTSTVKKMAKETRRAPIVPTDETPSDTES